MIDLDAPQALEAEELADPLEGFFALAVDDGQVLSGMERAGEHPPDTDASHVIVVVEGGDQCLERRVAVQFRHGDMCDDRVEKLVNVTGPAALSLGQIGGGPSLPSGGVDKGEFLGVFIGAQVDQQAEDLLVDPVGPRVGAVHLVDDHQRGQPGSEGLGQYVAGLGHDTLGGIDEQQHAVGHLQYALHLAGEIRVPRGVNDVDVVTVAAAVNVVDRAVLGQDGDATLPLQGIGVHDAIPVQLAVVELAALAQQLVNQRGLAMIHVGDDGDVANTFALHDAPKGKKARGLSRGRAPAGSARPPRRASSRRAANAAGL